MTSHARRKQRARARQEALGLPYTAARHTVVRTLDPRALCPAWCVEHDYHLDPVDPVDNEFAIHNGVAVPIGPNQVWAATAIQLHAMIGTRPSESTIDVVVRVGIGDGGSDDLWWPVSEAAVLHAALGELISAIDQPLDAAGCPTWCVRHEDCEPDYVDPDSLASVMHSSASIPVPSFHMGEFAIRIDSDIDTDGGRTDEILISEGKVVYVLWLPDHARTAHSVLAAALHTAATDPRVPPAAIAG